MKVSIIMPVYNMSRYLKKSVDSVLIQTHKDLELILVDDGSTDKSFKICEKLAKQDKRIRLLKQENNGIAFARNSALKVCRGDYILFLNPNEYIDKDYLEYVLGFVDEDKCDCVVTNEFENKAKEKIKVLKHHNYIYEMTNPDSGFGLTVSNKLYRRDLINKLFKINKSFEEIIFNAYYFIDTSVVVYSNKCFTHRFEEKKRKIRKNLDDRLENTKLLIKLYKDFIPNMDEQFLFFEYYMFIEYVNDLIINRDSIDGDYVYKYRKEIKENMNLFKKTNYSFKRKMEFKIFAKSFETYRKIYKLFI